MDLTQVSTPDLERLRSVLVGGRLRLPLSRFGLQSEGLEVVAELAPTLNALGREGVLAVIDSVLCERTRTSQASLVWTGPESRASEARDTAVVLADVFHQATSTVLLAGFAFDHASDVLNPLHGAMKRGIQSRIFADMTAASTFLKEHWPFGPPFPEVFGFVPARGVFASLHAKCVVVDSRWVFVTSANFTDRGQTRNIEVGVLLEDRQLASVLEAQFAGADWFKRVA